MALPETPCGLPVNATSTCGTPGVNHAGADMILGKAISASNHSLVAPAGIFGAALTADSNVPSKGLFSGPMPINVQSPERRISSFPRGQTFFTSFEDAPSELHTRGRFDCHRAARSESSLSARAICGG